MARFFEEVLRDVMKEEGGAKRQELYRARKEAEKLEEKLEEKLLRADEAYIEGEIAQDSYARLKASYDEQLVEVRIRIDRFEEGSSLSAEQIHWSLQLMTRLDAVFAGASVEAQHELVGSIFPAGLLFERGIYRTPQRG